MPRTVLDSFVYCWTDRLHGKLYVGLHKGAESDGYICSSKNMLQQYKMRPHDFTRQIIGRGTYEDCRTLEIKIIKAMFADKINCYNLNAGGAIQFTDEIKEKIRNAKLGKKGPPMPEHLKQIMKAVHTGKIVSQATRDKMSAVRKGVKNSPETRAKKSAWQVGRKLSEEHKANIRKAHLARKLCLEPY